MSAVVVTAPILTCADVQIGDRIIFETAYGAEEVKEIVEHWVGMQVLRDRDGVIISEPRAGGTSTPWTMLKFGVSGPTWGTRYIVRFTHEPATKVEMR